MQKIINNIGNPPSSLPIYEHLFSFIDDVLHGFLPLNTTNTGSVVTSEDDITQDLVAYFEDKQEFSNHTITYSFKFENQSKQGKNRTDIGVRLGRKYSANRSLFCWIEAKRLPIPNKKNRDEREYVIVSQEKINGKKRFKGNGGIQRFKENAHASNLPYSIIIGYIQEYSAEYWFKKINGWIKQLITENSLFWSDNDYLSQQESKKGSQYQSIHTRNNNNSITLRHFWIKL